MVKISTYVPWRRHISPIHVRYLNDVNFFHPSLCDTFVSDYKKSCVNFYELGIDESQNSGCRSKGNDEREMTTL